MTDPILPAEFVARMAAMLGDDLDAFLSASRSPPAGLRVNTLKLTVEEFERRRPFEVARVAFPAEAFLIGSATRPGRHPYHAAGLYYLQDVDAMMVGALAGARPGERVLDLAAAPGGKATHLAARMENEGVLIANDVNRSRATELARNLERCGVRNAIVTSESAERLAARLPGFFDRVLVDAPCSGESMFHKSAAAREDWSPEVVRGCAGRQAPLLRAAAEMVRPGGVLVYSTCTFSREENEAVIDRFLAEAGEFEPADLEWVPGAERVAVGTAATRGPDGPGQAAYRLWPHRVPGAGHFVAAMRRSDDAADSAHGAPTLRRKEREGKRRHRATVNGFGDAPGRGSEGIRDARSAVRNFVAERCPGFVVDVERSLLRGDVVFEVPAGAPPLSGLNVVRPGFELGAVGRGGRFDPAHALALAMPVRMAAIHVDLSVDDPRVDEYLRGHPIESPGPGGWVPVAVDGFVLGWGKRVDGRVKNHYPKGLRLMGG